MRKSQSARHRKRPAFAHRGLCQIGDSRKGLRTVWADSKFAVLPLDDPGIAGRHAGPAGLSHLSLETSAKRRMVGGLMDWVATHTGHRTTVRHADRWTITYTEGAPFAHISAPDGRLVGTLPVSGAAPVTVNSLSAALLAGRVPDALGGWFAPVPRQEPDHDSF